ncbi:MAG TPA: phosphotransferase [Nocardioidaceae bacterium]|nr:phosphotransferase [Nocardioidaceae bacterium]
MTDALAMLGGDVVPLSGGYSGETFLVEASTEQAVLRIYGREPHRVTVDAALLELMRGLVPVPRVLELQTPEQGEGPAYLLAELLPGRRLDEVLPTAGTALRETIGRNVGAILARLSGVPFRTAGPFADASLTPDPDAMPAEDLVSWARRHLREGALSLWSAVDRGDLLRLADAADVLLDEPDRRCCLVHSDFNAKNLLVDPDTGAVTGVLDWEFAHAWSPYSDLGNLLRFERDPCFADAVLAEYVDRAPPVPSDLVERAHAQDLWALVELAGRVGTSPVATRAHELLLAMVREQDVTAVPAPGPSA